MSKKQQSQHVLQAKDLAKSITTNLKQLGVDIKLGQAQELIARLSGRSNWATVLAAKPDAAKLDVPFQAPLANPVPSTEQDDGVLKAVGLLQDIASRSEIDEADGATVVLNVTFGAVLNLGLDRKEIAEMSAAEMRVILAQNFISFLNGMGTENAADCIETCRLIEVRDDSLGGGKNVLWSEPARREMVDGPASKMVCKKCGSDLDELGYCSDSACAYSDWPQDVTWDDLKTFDAEEMQACRGFSKRIRVSGEVHSDDRVFEVELPDVAPWLKEAESGEIVTLASEGWGRCVEADGIAEFFSDEADVSEMFAYVTRRHGIGYECTIDRDQAMQWLAKNRADVWALILCDEHDVSLVQAEEDEIRGMWDWLCRETADACDCSFATKEEAAMNAVAVLGLDCKSGD